MLSTERHLRFQACETDTSCCLHAFRGEEKAVCGHKMPRGAFIPVFLPLGQVKSHPMLLGSQCPPHAQAHGDM